jgi:hypothetical protein
MLGSKLTTISNYRESWQENEDGIQQTKNIKKAVATLSDW